MIGEAKPEALIAPGAQVAVYDVTGALPFASGAAKLIVACALPAPALPMAGASGSVALIVRAATGENIRPL